MAVAAAEAAVAHPEPRSYAAPEAESEACAVDLPTAELQMTRRSGVSRSAVTCVPRPALELRGLARGTREAPIDFGGESAFSSAFGGDFEEAFEDSCVPGLRLDEAVDTSTLPPSGDSSPGAAAARRGHRGADAAFHERDQTLVIFDWDDTLCPSSFCMENLGLSDASPVPEEYEQALEEFAAKVKALLKQVHDFAAQVVIVTNGGDGWVESSCAAWMPDLVRELELVDVVSARAKWEPAGISSPTGWKAREFESVIDRFYSQRPARDGAAYFEQSWKNVIAVGDAPYEHDALQRVMQVSPSPSDRSKSVRFLTKPSIEALGAQISTLGLHLENIVTYDGSLDFQVPDGAAVLE